MQFFVCRGAQPCTTTQRPPGLNMRADRLVIEPPVIDAIPLPDYQWGGRKAGHRVRLAPFRRLHHSRLSSRAEFVWSYATSCVTIKICFKNVDLFFCIKLDLFFASNWICFFVSTFFCSLQYICSLTFTSICDSRVMFLINCSIFFTGISEK